MALATGKHPLRGFARPAEPDGRLQAASRADLGAPPDLAGIVQLVFFRGGYVGACLVEDGILSVAWVMQDHLLRTVGSDWPAQRAHLSRQSSLIGDLLAGARPLSARPAATAAIPYGFLRAEPIAPEVFPVGDQLAVVPSFTGDGMAIALYSGLEAAQAVLAGTVGRRLPARSDLPAAAAVPSRRRHRPAARNAGDLRHRHRRGQASAAACDGDDRGDQAQGIRR